MCPTAVVVEQIAYMDHASHNRRSQPRAAIPEPWRELGEQDDELLVELLANSVESKAVVRADVDDVKWEIVS